MMFIVNYYFALGVWLLPAALLDYHSCVGYNIVILFEDYCILGASSIVIHSSVWEMDIVLYCVVFSIVVCKWGFNY
jgi:hypothetical protein